jgi:hypothetical protein
MLRGSGSLSLELVRYAGHIGRFGPRMWPQMAWLAGTATVLTGSDGDSQMICVHDESRLGTGMCVVLRGRV